MNFEETVQQIRTDKQYLNPLPMIVNNMVEEIILLSVVFQIVLM